MMQVGGRQRPEYAKSRGARQSHDCGALFDAMRRVFFRTLGCINGICGVWRSRCRQLPVQIVHLSQPLGAATCPLRHQPRMSCSEVQLGGTAPGPDRAPVRDPLAREVSHFPKASHPPRQVHTYESPGSCLGTTRRDDGTSRSSRSSNSIAIAMVVSLRRPTTFAASGSMHASQHLKVGAAMPHSISNTSSDNAPQVPQPHSSPKKKLHAFADMPYSSQAGHARQPHPYRSSGLSSPGKHSRHSSRAILLRSTLLEQKD